MKLMITYCTLLKCNVMSFIFSIPKKKIIIIIHTRASPTFSTSLTKFVSLHNMNQDYLLSNSLVCFLKPAIAKDK